VGGELDGEAADAPVAPTISTVSPSVSTCSGWCTIAPH